MLREAVAPGSGEVVDHEHLVAARQEPVCQVRPNEAGAAGDQHFHASAFARRRNEAARS